MCKPLAALGRMKWTDQGAKSRSLASAEKEAMNVSWGMAEGVPREVVAFELDLSRLIQL